MSAERLDLVVVLDALELGPARPVGVLTRWPGAALSVAFAYARPWLDDADRHFAIDPALPLGDVPSTIPARRLPGILADTAPDKWGESLLARRSGGRTLDAWDFMTGVADVTRMGALRLGRAEDGPFIADWDSVVPPLDELGELQELARRFDADPRSVSADQVGRLVSSGSSLGGARPKANFLAPDGACWIAKFPTRTDRRDVSGWEQVYATLARAAGVDISPTELTTVVASQRTFVTRRFDRTPEGRRLYASALTLTGRATASDATSPDYIDIAEAITNHGAPDRVGEDLAQLYRRMAFNVFAGNRDDHLRNQGFLRHADGWRLAPAFDLNPVREMREHATAVNGQVVAPTATDVLDVHSFFALAEREARAIIREVAGAVGAWPEVATAMDIDRGEQRQVAPAFDALETAAMI